MDEPQTAHERHGLRWLLSIFGVIVLSLFFIFLSGNGNSWATAAGGSGGTGGTLPPLALIVTSTNDSPDLSPGDGICDDGAGNCTLRAAVMETNASAGEDTIDVPAGIYALAIDGLDVTDDLVIIGEGADQTIIDAAGIARVVNVHIGVRANFQGMTFKNGSARGGAGIWNSGTLTLTDSAVHGNRSGPDGDAHGGGIWNDHVIFIVNSVVSGNMTTGVAGGMFNLGEATVTNSTFTENRTDRVGSAIHNHDGGTLTLIASTLSRNFGQDGAIYSTDGRLVVTNSSFSKNEATSHGAALWLGHGTTTSITNSTLSDNSAPGSTITNFGALEILNTIVANTVSGNDCFGGGFTSLGHNLDSDGTCGLTHSTDFPSTDPRLGPLQNNGGSTETHALLAGSPAIDSANTAAAPGTDQRGVARPQEGAADIGAFEKSLVVTNTLDSGPGSLRQAIIDANSDPDRDTIAFLIPGEGPHSILPLSALPALTEPAVIDGYTQPGAVANTNGPGLGLNTALKIEINGMLAGTGQLHGLVIAGGDSVIRGLVVNRFFGDGIRSEGAGGNVIEGNFLGTSVTGELPASLPSFVVTNLPETSGTYETETVFDHRPSESDDPVAPWSEIPVFFRGTEEGGSAEMLGTASLIYRHRVEFESPIELTSLSVTGAAFNGDDSVIRVLDEFFNVIGSIETTGGNALRTHVVPVPNIAGSTFYIEEFDDSSGWRYRSAIVINGHFEFGNRDDGVDVRDADNVVGGSNPASKNLVSGNHGQGVLVTLSGATRNVVSGNFAGTDRHGVNPLPNGFEGILIGATAIENRIGGSTPGERNLISGNRTFGIQITGVGAEDNLVIGNYVGVDVTGTRDLGNTLVGVGIGNGAERNVIGGDDPAERNIISGNDVFGVWIAGGEGAHHNRVVGNYIGTDVTGTNAIGNTDDGIWFNDGSSHNQIGGTAPGEGNLISGNRSGIAITGLGSDENLVQGNIIGLDLTGSVSLSNSQDGIEIHDGSSNNIIGGSASNAGNLISSNHEAGVRMSGADVSGNVVQGNLIGTDSTGSFAIGNHGWGGVVITDGSSDNTVGGIAPGGGNVISGNHGNGVVLAGFGTERNVFQGNLVGMDASGSFAVPNMSNGFEVWDGPQHNVIGGDSPAARNIISGNQGPGIRFIQPGTMANTVTGNFIGTDAAGTSPIGNSHGVEIVESSSNNRIGGPNLGEGNLISGNRHSGIVIAHEGTTGNTVVGNKIGTDFTGTSPIGNGTGIEIVGGASDNRVGGPNTGEGNLISGNRYSGIEIAHEGTMGNVVQGNLVGTDITGTTGFTPGTPVTTGFTVTAEPGTAPTWDVGTEFHGFVSDTANATGPWLGESVFFRGHEEGGGLESIDGVPLVSRFRLEFDDVTELRSIAVSGVAFSEGGSQIRVLDEDMNLLGTTDTHGGNDYRTFFVNLTGVSGRVFFIEETDWSGTWQYRESVVINGPVPLGNRGWGGIVISNGAQENLVGGSTVNERNIISGNLDNGVVLANERTVRNRVEGNYIGTDITGTIAIGNQGWGGVLVVDGAADNTIGKSLTVLDELNTIYPTQDTFITKHAVLGGPDSVHATDPVMYAIFAGAGSPYHSYPLIQFDLSAFTGSEVVGPASLELFVVGTAGYFPQRTRPVSVHEVLIDWDSSTTLNTFGSVPDVQFGADASDALDLQEIAYPAPGNRFISWTIPESLIQKWIDHPESNYGLILFNQASQTGADLQFEAVEGSHSPRLAFRVEAGGGNVIAGNQGNGVVMAGSGTDRNVFQGNLVGTDVSGSFAVPNMNQGLLITDGASHNFIGGSLPGEGNLLSGNRSEGIEIRDSHTTGTIIHGNFIGTDVTGMFAISNYDQGINIVDSPGNMIGGTDGVTIGGDCTGACNLISGNNNNAEGLSIRGEGSTGNVVVGNYIGTDITGRAALGNHWAGVMLRNRANGNFIGGTDPAQRNVISGGLTMGVQIRDGSFGNTVQGNYIGVDATGTRRLGNQTDGVQIATGAHDNWIGGPDSGAGNVISASGDQGVRISDEGTNRNTVAGNFIGTDATGTSILSPGSGLATGFTVTVDPNTAPTWDANTDFDGFVSDSADMAGPLTDDSVHFRGHAEGGNLDQIDGIPLVYRYRLEFDELVQLDSISVSGAAFGGLVRVLDENLSVIGETHTFGGNAFNTFWVELGGVEGDVFFIEEADHSPTWQYRESITINGPVPIGNANSGVIISWGARENVVGGTGSDDGNLISGNGGEGALINGIGAEANTVVGNLIGTDVTGSSALGNRREGVLIREGATHNVIGGSALSEGNLISGNGMDGVRIEGPGTGYNVLAGNFVGTDLTGTYSIGNGSEGIHVLNSAHNVIGGTTGVTPGGPCTGACNLVSGNQALGADGIVLRFGESTGNVVQGNFLGTDITGTQVISNNNSGLLINNGASGNLVGGSVPGAGNLISGNGFAGINVIRESSDNVIQGNHIGTDATGSFALGNSGSGVFIGIGSTGTTVGGTLPGEGNLVANNVENGIFVGNGSERTELLSNIVHSNGEWGIVLDASGESSVNGNEVFDNAGVGIGLRGASGNTVEGNVSHHNGEAGFQLSEESEDNLLERNVSNDNAGRAFQLLQSSGNRLESNEAVHNEFGFNFIGPASDNTVVGNESRDNVRFGFRIAESEAHVFEGNTAVGNGDDGFRLVRTNDNEFIGNISRSNVRHGFFPLDNSNRNSFTGNQALTNGEAGFFLRASSDNLFEDNVASDNGGAGIVVESGTGNEIHSSSILSNGGLGIDLGADGVSLNDHGDADTGPNNLQNFPVISSAVTGVTGGSGTTISGSLNSNPNTQFRLEFFANSASDPSGYGEGERFIGSADVTTNPGGVGTFDVSFAGPVVPGEFITATATSSDGDTSEFSVAFEAENSAPLAQLLVSSSPDRSAPLPLAGAVLEGSVYIFLDIDPAGVSNVEFFVDGAFQRRENIAPYDLAGGSVAQASGFSVAPLPEGPHTVVANAHLTGGGMTAYEATFVVETGSLQVSTSPDRSSPIALQDAVLDGSAFIYMDIDPAGVSNVEFFVDGKFQRQENIAPYDLAGGSVATANGYSVEALSEGPHTVVANAHLTGGGTVAYEATFEVENSPLLVSTSPDRSFPVALEGAVLVGPVYVFLHAGPDGITKVEFLLDGSFMRRENLAPYDFAGGSVETASGFDTGSIAAGPHTVTAIVYHSGGGTTVVEAVFEIPVPEPGISIEKSPITQEVATGGIAEFRVTVSNTGDTGLFDVTVADLLAPDCERNVGTLAVADSITFDCSFGPVTENFFNEVSASGVSGDGQLSTADDWAYVHAVTPVEMYIIEFSERATGDITSEDLDELIEVALLTYGPDVCVQRDGVIIIEQGTAECLRYPSEPGNIAIAFGPNAFADASGGQNNIAVAVNDSEAIAVGDDQYSLAFNSSWAISYPLRDDFPTSGNRAKAIDNSQAWTDSGVNSTATAYLNSYAEAVYPVSEGLQGGNNSTALAINNGFAAVGGGSNNLAISRDSSCAVIESEDGQVVIANAGELIGPECFIWTP